MRLATLRTDERATVAVRVETDDSGAEHAVPLPWPDVVALLRDPSWRRLAEQPVESARSFNPADIAPLVNAPGRVFCVGQNYAGHIAEMGREPPDFPTLFSKFASSLVGAYDPIVLPAASGAVDWEAEFAIVIGSSVRAARTDEATAAIAGYTIVNDVTARDWQRRTSQWLQGKAWDRSTPCGPVLVTADEVDPSASGAPDLAVRCSVNDEVMQDGRTSDLVFNPADVVAYISTFTTLQPGDLIATGTPAGVGAGRTPPRYLAPGDVVRTEIENVGVCENRCVAADPSSH